MTSQTNILENTFLDVPPMEQTPIITRTLIANFVDQVPLDIYVDVSNVYSSMKHNLGSFLRAIENGQLLNRRIAFGSKVTPDLCDWERHFQSFGYQTRCEIRPSDDYESMVDDCLAAHIYRITLRTSEKVRINVVSGDGNQKNSTAVGIYDAILMALMYGMPVTVWGWNGITSNNYKNLVTRFPTLFQVKFLDEVLQLNAVIPRASPKVVINSLGARAYHHMKIITKDKAPFPKNSQEDNTRLFGPLFGNYFCVSVSKSPVKITPFIVFAYFTSAEEMDKAFEEAQKHPYLTINGAFEELEFEKCAAPGTKKCETVIEAGSATEIVGENVSDGILPTPDMIIRDVMEERQKPDIYSILIKGDRVVLPKIDARNMKRWFSENLKEIPIPISFSSASAGESTKDPVFCNFPTEEFAKQAIRHFQQTKSIVINGSVYPIVVSQNPQKFVKRDKVSAN